MSEIWVLVSLCLAMLAGCYIAGSIPLVVSLSEVRNAFKGETVQWIQFQCLAFFFFR